LTVNGNKCSRNAIHSTEFCSAHTKKN
jgi:hypothetical protein